MTTPIGHGWTTAEPDDPAFDVSADELNQHVVSGLTAGHVLRATAADSADFQAIQDADLPASIARDSEVTSAVSAAVAALSTVYQPLDADLTAIAALTTTAFGRAVLALADQAALLAAAGAAASGHTHGGTYQPLDSDLTSIAALTTTSFGRGLLALADQAALLAAAGASASAHAHSGSDITSGTVADARVDSALARDSEVTSAVAAHTGDTTDAHVASAIGFTPNGSIAATDVQAAIQEVRDEAASGSFQPLDSDLTAIAALATTSFGRGLLALADAAALLAASGGAAASHAHAGEDITSGTVADARTASTLARDSEVTSAIGTHEAAGDPHPGYLTAAEGNAAYQPLDSDLTALAAISPSNDDVVQRKAGAWTNRTIAQLLTDLATPGTTFQPLDSDLTSIAALTTTSFGRGLLALADAAALRTSGGLVIGTDVEAHDADLTTIAGLSASNDDVVQRKSGAWANRTIAQLLTDLAAPGTTFQPLDSDLTAIAALTTTSFGRGLLAKSGYGTASGDIAEGNHTHAATGASFVSIAKWGTD